MCTALFFFTAPPTTEIYTLSLHDALPISRPAADRAVGYERSRTARSTRAAGGTVGQRQPRRSSRGAVPGARPAADRKSTRLNSSHPSISYAVFCLKKKNKQPATQPDLRHV